MTEIPVAKIGDNIKRLCGMHAVSQETLASHVSMSKQGLNNIVVGRSQPSFVTAQKVAVAFGISVDDLAADTATCMQSAANAMYESPIFQEVEIQRERFARRIQDAKDAKK